jgi:excisionase family DNA binding protein
MTTEKRAYTIAQFCSAYGIGPTTLNEEVQAGRLTVRRVGRRVLISADDADRWFNGLPSENVSSAA